MAGSDFVICVYNDCNPFLLQVVLCNPPVLIIVYIDTFLTGHLNQVQVGSQTGILMDKLSASYENCPGFPEILRQVLPVLSLDIVWEVSLVFLIISPAQMPVIHN